MKSLPALLALVFAACFASADAPKFNLLYITADDMNADSPGWMGGKMGATPVLDTLAGTCHRFVNNHVTAPICQPSREAMFTGRVPHRSGALGFNPVKPGTPTMVTALKSAGYFTAAINKTPHLKPEAEFPWDDKIEGSGKNPPLLRGEKQDARDFVITHVNTVSSGIALPQRCIRTEDWALMFHACPDGNAKFRVEAMSGITFKAIEAAGQTDERIAGRVKQLRVGEPPAFFNEQTDSGERGNLVSDSHYRAEVERLASLLLAHMEKTEDPQTANFKKALADWKEKNPKQKP